MNIIKLNQSEVSVVSGGFNIPMAPILAHVGAFLGVYGMVLLNMRYSTMQISGTPRSVQPRLSKESFALLVYGCFVVANMASNAVGFVVEEVVS